MNSNLQSFVNNCAEIAKPDKIEWITGNGDQLESLAKIAMSTGEMIKLNEELLPNCYLHRSALNDVARVEGRTYICCRKEEDAGPTNNWMDPEKAYSMLTGISTAP